MAALALTDQDSVLQALVEQALSLTCTGCQVLLSVGSAVSSLYNCIYLDTTT